MKRLVQNHKKLLTYLVIAVFIITSLGITIYTKAAADVFQVARVPNTNRVQVGDIVEVKYSIKPEPITVDKVKNNKQKDIVLVIDTSGSMSWIPEADRTPNRGEKSRLTIMKEVANKFINNLSENDKAKISLVEYSTHAALIKDSININSNNISNELIPAINFLNAGGSTNIGDGLRVAYNQLSSTAQGHDKYIVFMTDGFPEAYSSNLNNKNSYFDGNTMPQTLDSESLGKFTDEKYNVKTGGKDTYSVYQSIGGRFDNSGKALDYAKIMAKKIGDFKDNQGDGIKTFILGFGNGGINSKNKDIADSAKGLYFQAEKEDTINNLYNEIQQIIDANVNGSFTVHEKLPSNFKFVGVDKLSENFREENGSLIGDINNVYYKLSQDKKTYVAEPFEFTVKYKIISDGPSILGQNNSSFATYKVLDKEGKITLPPISFNLVNTQVSMEVSDITGALNSYNSSDQYPISTRYDKFINNEKIILKGDAFANISITGTDLNFASYQFINSIGNPTSMPTANWKNIDLTQKQINEDILLEKPGYLTWRGYDVNHLITISDENSWNNPDKVFVYPNGAIDFKSAANSKDINSYGKWENIVPYTIKNVNGQNVTVKQKWVSNTIFMDDFYIGGDYKEASKFWGYLKVPEDGYYTFGAYSDDGARAYITIDGEVKQIVDRFNVQSSTFDSNYTSYKLQKDKYYPIYMEYFNWGGAAHFSFQYKYSTSVNSNNNFQPVSKDWFYPSKTNTPGEYAKNIFTGNKGIQFPKEPGKYYIAYQAGKTLQGGKVEVQKEGIYGPFIVDPRGNFTLTRSFSTNASYYTGEDMEIIYTIKPEDIPMDYINNGNFQGESIADTYIAEGFRVEEVFPSGINLVNRANNLEYVINDNKITGEVKNQIQYNLVQTNGRYSYKANPITFSIWIKATEVKEYELKSQDSKLTFKDLDEGEKQGNFPTLNFQATSGSSILKQGIFKNDPTEKYLYEDGNQSGKAVTTMPITLGLLVSINSNSSEIKLNIAGSLNSSAITFKKYEVSQGKIQYETLQQINGTANQSFNSSNTTLEKGKEYVILYTIIPTGSINDTITSKAAANEKREDIFKLILDDLPDIF